MKELFNKLSNLFSFGKEHRLARFGFLPAAENLEAAKEKAAEAAEAKEDKEPVSPAKLDEEVKKTEATGSTASKKANKALSWLSGINHKETFAPTDKKVNEAAFKDLKNEPEDRSPRGVSPKGVEGAIADVSQLKATPGQTPKEARREAIAKKNAGKGLLGILGGKQESEVADIFGTGPDKKNLDDAMKGVPLPEKEANREMAKSAAKESARVARNEEATTQAKQELEDAAIAYNKSATQMGVAELGKQFMGKAGVETTAVATADDQPKEPTITVGKPIITEEVAVGKSDEEKANAAGLLGLINEGVGKEAFAERPAADQEALAQAFAGAKAGGVLEEPRQGLRGFEDAKELRDKMADEALANAKIEPMKGVATTGNEKIMEFTEDEINQMLAEAETEEGKTDEALAAAAHEAGTKEEEKGPFEPMDLSEKGEDEAQVAGTSTRKPKQ